MDRSRSRLDERRLRVIFLFVFLQMIILPSIILYISFRDGPFNHHRSFYEPSRSQFEAVDCRTNFTNRILKASERVQVPYRTSLSLEVERKNLRPHHNCELYPQLKNDRLILVLYVHNRPQYLSFVVESLSKVVGINETLLIISHDGYYSEMNQIVESIKFCRVKQIYFPFSPHLFPASFPGVSPGDCSEKQNPITDKCQGNADQYGNHRSPWIVSLKHHWWWMMNTVWDGLEETQGYNKPIIFIEEDHYLYPSAYRNIQMLYHLMGKKCPECLAINLAPANANSRGENTEYLYVERIGNIGYGLNRSVWERIHNSSKKFCYFDDYNWDSTMLKSVYPSWGTEPYTLRGPRSSAVHFGTCGLHEGQAIAGPVNCSDDRVYIPPVDTSDEAISVYGNWKVVKHKIHQIADHATGFGGWGDERDHLLCLDFASMYR